MKSMPKAHRSFSKALTVSITLDVTSSFSRNPPAENHRWDTIGAASARCCCPAAARSADLAKGRIIFVLMKLIFVQRVLYAQVSSNLSLSLCLCLSSHPFSFPFLSFASAGNNVLWMCARVCVRMCAHDAGDNMKEGKL